MTELKTSTGRPVLAATSHKSNRNVDSKPRDQFGQPLEYCTFHFETTLGINLCVAGPRMIDGGKIMKPTIEQQTAGKIKITFFELFTMRFQLEFLFQPPKVGRSFVFWRVLI